MKKYIVIIVAVCCILSGCITDPQHFQPETDSQSAAQVHDMGKKVVDPLPATVHMDNLDNQSLRVSIDEGGIYPDDAGNVRIQFTVYNYDLYDMANISALAAGDSINILGEHVTVSSVEREETGDVIINGGLDVGGYELRSDDSGMYYQIGYNDAKSYYAIGEADLGISSDFVFADGIDFDNPPVNYNASDLLEDNNGIFYHFVPSNTKIVVEDGQIVAMERTYIP